MFMNNHELPLYPKVSSSYNKILQLLIAIMLMILLMNLWLVTSDNDEVTIKQHVKEVSHHLLSQANVGLQVLLANDDQSVIEEYINQLAALDYVYSVHFYDVTGQVVFSAQKNNQLLALENNEQPLESELVTTSGDTVSDLFGLTPSKQNSSRVFIPFVQEVRSQKLLGYLRMTIKKSYLDKGLKAASYKNSEWLRLMMFLAGVVGFFLTRGLGRFSRQGLRLAKA